MSAAPQTSIRLSRAVGPVSDSILVLGVVLIVVMMVIPLPPRFLDLLLTLNFGLALLLLMLTMNVREPLELAVFPALLLVATLYRLALNVSSTRLILLEGYAGQIIQAFGNFVVGGNYVVGFVVFLILVIIQFIVITKGAERVAEVAARFTLDAMPGKQMSIDADLNSGLIDEEEARRRRRDVEREADFYGAMDGASKFVKGDAIASVVITIVNVLGGFAVGVGQKGLPFDQALQQYTLLTVGDGLVTQIPALLISTATGLIVTRAASEASMGQDVGKQVLSQPRVLYMASAVLLFFALVPGLPPLPFAVLSALCAASAWLLSRRIAQEDEARAEREREAELAEIKRPESVSALLQVDKVELEIGYSLIPLVDVDQGGDLLDRITTIRRQLAMELGLVVPAIRIRDNMQLPPNRYTIKVQGIEVASGEALPNHFLAMDSGAGAEPIDFGVPTREPAFGLPARWVPQSRRDEAEQAGYTVVDPPSVLATHLTEVLKAHAPEILGRQEVKNLLDGLKEEHSAVVEELVPELLTLGDVQRVLRNLLAEGIPIRNLATILEILADASRVEKDTDALTERVREGLARQITKMYALDGNTLHAITLDPAIEEELAAALEHTDRGPQFRMDPSRLAAITHKAAGIAEEAASRGQRPVLLCASPLRLPLRRLTHRALPRLPIMAYSEVASGIEVESVGMVSLNHEG